MVPEDFDQYVAPDYVDYGHTPPGIGPAGARDDYDQGPDRGGRQRDDGGRAGSPALIRARLLRSATALRRGPLLDDVATDAIRKRLAAPWEESWLAAREDAIDAEMSCGMHRELLPELMELSAEHPFRERFTVALMRALDRSGRAADALATYAEAERSMRRSLAIAPGARLQALQAAILRGDPS